MINEIIISIVPFFMKNSKGKTIADDKKQGTVQKITLFTSHLYSDLFMQWFNGVCVFKICLLCDLAYNYTLYAPLVPLVMELITETS